MGPAANEWASHKWVRLKLQVGCTNQQKILIGLFDVMWVVLSVHAPGGCSGPFVLRSVKKTNEQDGGYVGKGKRGELHWSYSEATGARAQGSTLCFFSVGNCKLFRIKKKYRLNLL